MTYNLYIGSNNKTKQLELDIIEKIIADSFSGATFTQTKGLWQGESERSVTVLVTVRSESILRSVINKLKTALDQDAIGYQEVPELRFA